MTTRKWMYDKATMDSVVASSKKPEEEATVRAATCEFILKIGNALGLPCMVSRTAMMYFQRYFATGTVADSQDTTPIAVASVFLASKSEDCPRRAMDVVRAAYGIQGVSDDKIQRLRSDLLVDEMRLLEKIGFDLSVEHPYKTLLISAKRSGCDAKTTKQAWGFVDDCYKTTLVLRFDAQEIASVALATAQGSETPAAKEMRSELDALEKRISSGGRYERDSKSTKRYTPY